MKFVLSAVVLVMVGCAKHDASPSGPANVPALAPTSKFSQSPKSCATIAADERQVVDDAEALYVQMKTDVQTTSITSLTTTGIRAELQKFSNKYNGFDASTCSDHVNPPAYFTQEMMQGLDKIDAALATLKR